MYLSARNRGRNLLLAVAASLAFIFYLSTSWFDSPPLESARLEQYMNSLAPTPKSVVKNSFDWSSIEFRYPPGELTPLPTGKTPALPKVQHEFGKESPTAAGTREVRRQEVKSLFQADWEAYRRYAWMKDALKPLSNSYTDQFSGWAATLVDTLDTLWMMGLRDEFDEAVEAVAGIDFGRSTSGRVNTFETNIRYLGGLLAAYDLSKREVLLAKAIELGDMLYSAFNTPNRMPVDFIDFEAAKAGKGLNVEGSVVSASPGTLSLELTRLSQLTGDSKYYDAISKITDLFYLHQNETALPGMWPMFVSMRSQDVVSGNQFTLAGCADSLYEYLPKMAALLQGRESQYETMSKAFMDTAGQHLLFRPMLPGGEDILIAGNVAVGNDGQAYLDPESEHLACYLGGTFALGGRLFNRPKDIETGEKLARGCIYGYRAFPTGMMPERYNMVACESRESCRWDEQVWIEERGKRAEWKEHLPKGFTTAKDPRYILRPEAIESVLILYRVTGNPEYQEAAWDMFQAIAKGTRVGNTHAAVNDVTKARDKLPQEDYMESFWMAETLKYFYLVFSPPDVISLDRYVFNTEAHPFLRAG